MDAMDIKIRERVEILKKAYIATQAAGLCETKKQFAELLGRQNTHLSAAMNGNPTHCTEAFVKLVNNKLIELGVVDRPISLKNDDDESHGHEKQTEETKSKYDIGEELHNVFCALNSIQLELKQISSYLEEGHY